LITSSKCYPIPDCQSRWRPYPIQAAIGGPGPCQIQLPGPIGHRALFEQGRIGHPYTPSGWKLVRGQDCQQEGHLPERGRRRLRSAQDILMPHIDIISKTAALKRELSLPIRSSPTRSVSSNSHCFERLRMRYESPEPQTQSYLSTSHPDMRDVHDISPHLSADWVAHRHPEPSKPKELPRKPQRALRASSTSPPRPARSQNHQISSQLTSCMKDIFANQKFDPNKHRPKARYVPDGAENGHQKSKDNGTLERLKKTAMVTFKGDL